jgi:hypothetical protein
LIWILSKLGLTTDLRRVPAEKISLSQARVRELQMTAAADQPAPMPATE